MEPKRADNPNDTHASAPAERVDEFVRLLGQNQRRVFLYVMSLAPNVNEAEEIVQETNLVLWREFGQFQSGTNFAAWACRVAFHQVLAWRKRKQRDRLQFSEEFLEAVAEEASASADVLEDRAQALERCMDKLPAAHRDLLRLRYSEGLAVDAIAGKLNRSVDAVYRTLSRVRHSLHGCVSQTRIEESPS